MSSSVFYAVGFKLPVIMFDLCDFNLFSYMQFSRGLIKVKNYTDLLSQSKKILFENKWRQKILEYQQKHLQYFAILDGNCTKRNVSEIMNYIR